MLIDSLCTFVFVCINKKNKGKCCSMFSSEEAYEHLKREINLRREMIINRNRIKIVKTSCLGQCAVGPNIFIHPDNIWYTFSCIEDLNDIIKTHFVEGKRVERLINKCIRNE